MALGLFFFFLLPILTLLFEEVAGTKWMTLRHPDQVLLLLTRSSLGTHEPLRTGFVRHKITDKIHLYM